MARRPRGLARFAELLPVDAGCLVTRGEGDTPLVPCPRLGARLGIPDLYVKNEGANPTWSWKDRLASLGVSAARTLGATVVAVASTGNQAAAVGAYAAAAGLTSVLLTSGDPSPAFRALLQVYGSQALTTATPEDRWTLLARGVRERGWFPLGGFVRPPVGSPAVAAEGYKTIAYELAEAFGWDVGMTVCVPVAYGDALAGIWRGFHDLDRLGWTVATPRLVAVEIWGSLARALAQGLDHAPVVPVPRPSRAVSLATPVSTRQALLALRGAGGTAVTADDGQLEEMQAWLAETEGFYAELASVASLVGAREAHGRGLAVPGRPTVAILSSSGLKDGPAPTARRPAIPAVLPDLAALDAALASTYGVGGDSRTDADSGRIRGNRSAP